MDVNLPSGRETLSGDVSAIGVTSSSGNMLSHPREIIPASHPSPPHGVQSLQIRSGTTHVGKLPLGSLDRGTA